VSYPENISIEFIDLMSKIFRCLPEERLTAEHILDDPFFSFPESPNKSM